MLKRSVKSTVEQIRFSFSAMDTLGLAAPPVAEGKTREWTATVSAEATMAGERVTLMAPQVRPQLKSHTHSELPGQ